MRTHSMPLVTIVLFWSAFVFAGIDDSGLKERLVEYYFNAGHDSVWQEFDTFKKQNAVSDEQLHRVLMAIYRETGDNRPALTPQSDDWKRNQGMAESVVRWLPKCGNVPVKDFLLDHMTAKEADGHIRQQAILAYLRVANAEEAKNVLLRFLVGEDRMDSMTRSSICRYARTAFIEAGATGKKAAILEALYVALSREDNKWLFRVYDEILCELNNDYAKSRQRIVMLQRLINTPPLCKDDEYAMPDLSAKLKELRKTRLTTNINTNPAVIMSRDVPPVAEPPASPPPQPRIAVPLAVGAGFLAAFALLWAFFRRRR